MIQLEDKNWLFADLTLEAGTHMFSGNQTNIKKLTVATGAIVNVQPYDPTLNSNIANPGTVKYGFVKFDAIEMIIDGIINASGAGYFGGGGGGGGGGYNGTSDPSSKTVGAWGGNTPTWEQNGFPASDGGAGGNGGNGGGGTQGGSAGHDGTDGRSAITGLTGGGAAGVGGAYYNPNGEKCGGGGGGGGGGGEFGGNGGNGGNGSAGARDDGKVGIKGGYSGTGVNGDTSINDDILMGSGGGGGGGGGGWHDDRSGVAGGGAGQRGGGKITLVFHRTFLLSLTGSILSHSGGVGNGGDGCRIPTNPPEWSGGPGGGGSVYIDGMEIGWGRNNGFAGYAGYAYSILYNPPEYNLGSPGTVTGTSARGENENVMGGFGGEGAGGGILIKFERKYNCLSAIEIRILGTINNYGGRTGATLTNGGTLKLVDIPNADSIYKVGATIKTGRSDGTGFIRYKPLGIMVL